MHGLFAIYLGWGKFRLEQVKTANEDIHLLFTIVHMHIEEKTCILYASYVHKNTNEQA